MVEMHRDNEISMKNCNNSTDILKQCHVKLYTFFKTYIIEFYCLVVEIYAENLNLLKSQACKLCPKRRIDREMIIITVVKVVIHAFPRMLQTYRYSRES